MLCIVLALTGCASFHTTGGFAPKQPVTRIAVMDFDSSDPAAGRLFADVIKGELAAKGFEIVDSNTAEIIITGNITRNNGGTWMMATKSWIDSASAIAKTINGDVVRTVRFDQGSAHVLFWQDKSPADIASGLGKKLAKGLH